MKGVVLAGGTGSRLWPLTHTGPKQLLPLANRPVLEYAIEDLSAAGIDEIGIILGNVGREQIRETLGDGSAFGVDLTYIVQGDPLGLADAVGCARDFVGSDPFVVFLGDNVFGDGVGGLIDSFDPEREAARVALREVDEPSRYGIADRDSDGRVTELVEKPEEPPTSLALVGVYAFTPSIFDQIDRLDPSWRGEYEITDAIGGLIADDREVRASVIGGWWADVGTPEDVVTANRHILEDLSHSIADEATVEGTVTGPVTLADDVLVEAGATVEGPAHIATGTTVGPGTHVGPATSVGPDCELENVTVRSSTVLADATIRCDRTIRDSLIGADATIGAASDESLRLVVADDTTMDI